MNNLYGDWRDIFKGFRAALDPRKISLAVGGILFSTIFIFIALVVFFTVIDDGIRRAVTELRFADLFGEVVAACMFIFKMKPSLLPFLFGVIIIAKWLVWAYFGGAISRIAAVEIAKDERIEIAEALRFAKKKYRSFFWSPMAMILAILFFAACNVAFGLLGRIPGGVGALLVSIPLPLAMVCGFFMTLLLIGLIAGFPLMIPTIAAEGTDSFDAISRSMSYVYARPWRYLWCKLVAFVYGIPCFLFVLIFVKLFMVLGLGTGAAGMGPGFRELNQFWQTGALPTTGLSRAAAIIFAAWVYLIIISVLGYVCSYLFTTNTITYLIIRKAEDGTEMTEVYEEEDNWKPETEQSSGVNDKQAE